MDDQQLLVGIVGGMIGQLTSLILLHYLWAWVYPSPGSRRYHRRAQKFLKVQEEAMRSFVRVATWKDPGEPR